MNRALVALLTMGFVATGLVYTHPAFAHNFGGDESASWLAKVAEIKTEVNLISKNVGQDEIIYYYNDVLGEYWNANDTIQMGERNTLLQTEIPTTINATVTDALAKNQTAVDADVSKLSGYLDESVPVRVDPDKIKNATVQALAVTFVLKEALERYGESINATVDLNDMSLMNMSAGSNMSGMSSGMSSTVVDQNPYENSVALATAAQTMFNDVAAKYPDKSDTNNKVTTVLAKLVQDIKNKADENTIMTDVHMNLHPVLIAGYNIQEATVPEFPLPMILIIISIAAVVATTRLKSRLGF